MNKFYSCHYITIDIQGCITAGWSDGPRPDRDITEAICINDKGGYQFRLFSSGEENPQLYTANGIPLYKWDGEQVIKRAEDEIEADRIAKPEPKPTEQEKLRADIDFLAALQGIVL